MNENRPEALAQWILEWFQRKQIVQEDQAVARRYFLREFDQLQADDGVDVLKERLTLMDPDSPVLGSYGECVEVQAEDSLGGYQLAMADGHGPTYSEVYGSLTGSDGPSTERMSVKAYEIINKGSASPTDNLGYHDAYQACIFQGKRPGFAKHCADHLIEETCSFASAFQAAAEHEKDYQFMLDMGHSELRARMYAESVRSKSGNFAEIYAECVEHEVMEGRTQEDAEKFASIHASIILNGGGLDEDDPENWRCELWYRVQAEADYRYRQEYGERTRFLEVFDQIHQHSYDDPEAGSQDWFDEIEERTKQRIAAQDAYIAAHGNLRGFKTADEEVKVKPPVDSDVPNPPDFRNMSDEEFEAYIPRSEEELDELEAEAKYRDWCEGEQLDSTDPDSRTQYKERGGDSWDDMDENDRDGWTDNMNKD